MNMRENDGWAADCRSELAVEHDKEKFLKFALLARVLGFTSVAYMLEIPVSVAEPAVIIYNNFAADWEARFLSRHPKYHSARVAAGKRSADSPDQSLMWTHADFTREAFINRITLDHVFHLRGRVGTAITIAFGCRQSEGEPPPRSAEVQTLAAIAAESLADALIPKFLPQHHLTLTPQEQKFLKWVLDGKAAGEIADIMNITQGSAANMQRKLAERFDRKGIFPTAFLAFQMGLLND